MDLFGANFVKFQVSSGILGTVIQLNLQHWLTFLVLVLETFLGDCSVYSSMRDLSLGERTILHFHCPFICYLCIGTLALFK